MQTDKLGEITGQMESLSKAGFWGFLDTAALLWLFLGNSFCAFLTP